MLREGQSLSYIITAMGGGRRLENNRTHPSAAKILNLNLKIHADLARSAVTKGLNGNDKG